MDIKAGDIVKHVDGGPAMTVLEVRCYGHDDGALIAECIRFDEAGQSGFAIDYLPVFVLARRRMAFEGLSFLI